MRQRIAVGVTNHLLRRRCITHEIALAGRIAPGAFRVPMPGLYEELGVLAIRYRPPPCFENLFDLVRPEKNVCSVAGNVMHGGGECAKRTEGVCCVVGGWICA